MSPNQILIQFFYYIELMKRHWIFSIFKIVTFKGLSHPPFDFLRIKNANRF
ncbi:MAG: hypothetical protein ACJASL_003120 [Paraglaciecola sp.]|jgi:hypothetical protein